MHRSSIGAAWPCATLYSRVFNFHSFLHPIGNLLENITQYDFVPSRIFEFSVADAIYVAFGRTLFRTFSSFMCAISFMDCLSLVLSFG